MNYITLGILIVILFIIVYLSYEKKNKKQEQFNNIKFKPLLNKTHDIAKYLILEK
jgi:hypothetical protein